MGVLPKEKRILHEAEVDYIGRIPPIHTCSLCIWETESSIASASMLCSLFIIKSRRKFYMHSLSLSRQRIGWSQKSNLFPLCLCFFIIWLKVTKVLYYIFPKPALKYTTHWKSFCVRNFDTQLTPGNYKQLLVISETPACSLKSYTVLFSFASFFFSNFFHNL